MKHHIKFDSHRLGLNCGSAPIRDLLEFNGHRFTEPMCFGLGSGLNFVYHHGGTEVLDKQFRAPITIITGRTSAPYVELCSVLGVKITVKRTHDAERAWEEVKQLVNQNIPVACDIDVEMIQNNNPVTERFGWHMGGHKTIMIGYDEQENSAQLIENMIKDPITVPLDLFTTMRSSADLYPSENEWFYIDVPEKLQDLEIALKMAIIKNVNAMKNPAFTVKDQNQQYHTTGIPGLEYWYSEILEWPSILDKDRLIASILTAFLQNNISGGGMYRKMYARFLREADDCLNIPALVDASNIYRSLSNDWETLIKLMMVFIDDEDESHFKDPAFEKVVNDIYTNEKRAFSILNEVSSQWLR
ncbi:BtrH N-terminal domain-containing protein [Metabacillus halosaccharovorans]|uniref:BtrH N-terminal domain-containing protein n=1 Tax=Metabacillus halosaccharovorans TaxID=930124 RepID=UPI003735E9A5